MHTLQSLCYNNSHPQTTFLAQPLVLATNPHLDSGLVAGGWGQVVQCCLVGDGRGGHREIGALQTTASCALHRTAMALKPGQRKISHRVETLRPTS